MVKNDRLILKGLISACQHKGGLACQIAQFPYSGRPRWVDDGQYICEIDIGLWDLMNKRKE